MPDVPHPNAIVDVAGRKSVELDHRPALQLHLYDSEVPVDACDVAKARHEQPAKVDRAIPPAELDPEDFERAPLAWRVGGPGIPVLGAVEVVAPERLLVTSPAQPPYVCRAVNGDAPIEEARGLG